MAKPIFIIGLNINIQKEIKEIHDSLEHLKQDYYVLTYFTSEINEPKFLSFFSSELDDLKFEELKSIISKLV